MISVESMFTAWDVVKIVCNAQLNGYGFEHPRCWREPVLPQLLAGWQRRLRIRLRHYLVRARLCVSGNLAEKCPGHFGEPTQSLFPHVLTGCRCVRRASVDKFGKTAFQGIETADEATLCAGIAAGHGIIANVRGGSHWVLLTGCQGGGVFDVNDPGFNQATYTMGDILQEAVYH